jgi:hypothetical protein
MKNRYHVVRLNYGVRNSDGNFHQTHRFSTHRLLAQAVKSLEKMEKSYNCVAIVNQEGKKMKYE